MKSRVPMLVAALVSVIPSVGVFAQSAGGVAPDVAALAEKGRAKATAVCAACHGANGISVAGHIPNLAGQRATYLAAQLRAFKTGTRKNDVMGAIAAQLTPDDMSQLAAHFASQTGASSDARSSFMPSLATTRVSFPEAFPKGFTPYFSFQNADRKTITTFYANDKALAAARSGKTVGDGAIIIGEVYSAKVDADAKPVLGADGKFVPDKVVNYTGMAFDAGWGKDIPDVLRNADWNYAAFTPDRKLRPNLNYAECFACHKPKESTSYLFTLADMAKK